MLLFQSAQNRGDKTASGNNSKKKKKKKKKTSLNHLQQEQWQNEEDEEEQYVWQQEYEQEHERQHKGHQQEEDEYEQKKVLNQDEQTTCTAAQHTAPDHAAYTLASSQRITPVPCDHVYGFRGGAGDDSGNYSSKDTPSTAAADGVPNQYNGGCLIIECVFIKILYVYIYILCILHVFVVIGDVVFSLAMLYR